jgi:FAD/FMN-containing dehydrogenase
VADAVVGSLVDVVGPGHVLTDADVRVGYEQDWTGAFGGPARAVVRPGSTAEVAAVVDACRAASVPIIPQGGNTGLVGGGVPEGPGPPGRGEIVLSTRRLQTIDPVDAAAGQITVGAGVTLLALQERLAPLGFEVGVDLASRSGATLGGMAATNAGGTRVLRHGTMRGRVVGAEAVLGTGATVTHLRGLTKDTTGYDLAGLLVGSEGTLGVITALRLVIDPRPAQRAAALVATTGFDAALATAVGVHRRLPTLEAAEVVDGATVELVMATLDLPPPVAGHPTWYVLLGAAGPGDEAEDLARALDATAGPSAVGVIDAVVAGDGPRVDALWRYRDRATESLAAAGPPRKLDVSVPVSALAAFVAAVPDAVARCAPGAVLHVFGHVLDGNLHCNLLGVPSGGGHRVDDVVLDLAVGLGGSIGGEHGIGRAKRSFLHLVRSPAEIDAFRAVKSALDPAGILNPGVLLPA